MALILHQSLWEVPCVQVWDPFHSNDLNYLNVFTPKDPRYFFWMDACFEKKKNNNNDLNKLGSYKSQVDAAALLKLGFVFHPVPVLLKRKKLLRKRVRPFRASRPRSRGRRYRNDKSPCARWIRGRLVTKETRLGSSACSWYLVARLQRVIPCVSQLSIPFSVPSSLG